MTYEIIDGRVKTRALEYHIVDHCNLSCDHCCSFSPMLPKWKCEPAQFEKDLWAIKEALRPEFLKIVGGEPLLHPQLVELLHIARRVGVAPEVSITTNGHLMRRLPAEAWGLFERLTVSIYPSPVLSKDLLRYIHKQAQAHDIRVSWKTQDKFVCLNRDDLATYEEAKATYAGCWIRHRCNSVKNGRFYSCTRPQYIQKLAEDPLKFMNDGVEMDAPPAVLAGQIKAHLEQTEPLNSCFLCKGGHAELKPQRQMENAEVSAQRDSLREICEKV